MCLGLPPSSTSAAATARNVAHHELRIELRPDSGAIQIIDTFHVHGTVEFALSSGLHPTDVSGFECAKPEALAPPQHGLRGYRISGNDHPITVCFEGRIAVTQQDIPTDMLRGGLGGDDAVLNENGAYLGPGSGWYPRLANAGLERFDLDVSLPDGWLAVSQGEGAPRDAYGHAHWRETNPQTGIHLVAGPWSMTREGPAEVYLRQPDVALAARYLAATQDYLALYETLIGPYPYAKFALIENLWESGWGMPSFTLLGGQVLRLPFILHTSYPHEILHNWWGNGVYVDYAQGNWSEGLTTYLADYALAERAGRGQSKRRDALTAYARYEGKGLALANFIGRHDRSSQAVGYGKSFMFFHMLRQRLGDAAFIAGLRRFYAEHRFQRAGYRELRAAFEAISGEDLGTFFQAWIQRSDAPQLSLQNVRVSAAPGGYRVRGQVLQSQSGEPYPLRVPIAIMAEDGPHEFTIKADAKVTDFDLPLPAPPTLLAVDPRNDLFRQLDAAEIPPALGEAMHADHIVLVLPRKAEPTLRAAYQDFANRWAESSPGIESIWDDEFEGPGGDQAVWYLGTDNRHRCELDNALEANGLSLPVHETGDSIALAIPSEHGPKAWLFTDNPQALPGLARKLPHYGRYAWLRFQGAAPSNIGKGDWPVTHSPLRQTFRPGAQLELSARAPLLPMPTSNSSSLAP